LVGRSAQFCVLNPQIGFDLLQGAEEGQNRDIAFGDWGAIFFLAAALLGLGALLLRNVRGVR